MVQLVPHLNPHRRLLMSTVTLNGVLPASLQSHTGIAVRNTIGNTFLPCFWKRTLSTSHLAEVKNEKQRGLLLSLGGGYGERESFTDNTTGKRLLSFFFSFLLMMAQSFTTHSLTVGAALE